MKDVRYPEEVKQDHTNRTLKKYLYHLDGLAPKELLRSEQTLYRNDTGKS